MPVNSDRTPAPVPSKRAARTDRARRADTRAKNVAEKRPLPTSRADADNDHVVQWRTLGSPGAGTPTTAAIVPRAWDGPRAPSPADASRADEVGRQLQGAFGQILHRMPPRVTRVADIARWLGLDRSICQRIVIGVRDATDGLGVLERFPGVRGLEQFVAAAVARGCPASASRAARRALDEYAKLVSAAGGSQARLVGQIEALRSGMKSPRGARGGAAPPRNAQRSDADIERLREINYQNAVELTGLASAARVDLVILAPEDPGSMGGAGGRVTTVSATGMIGVETSPDAMPLTRRSRLAGLRPVPARTGSGATPPPSGVTPDLLLRPFTSDPPPRVTTRTEGEYLIQIFNMEDGVDGASGDTSPPFDVVAALAFSWTWDSPTKPPNNYYSIGRVIGPPARRLVFDVYLHRALPPPVSVSAHVLRPGMQGSLGDARPQSRWFDRLPIEHDLILLGGAPGDRPSEGYGRLRELTRHLLDSMGWSNEPFTGYRLEVPCPLFDMEYVIAAEF